MAERAFKPATAGDLWAHIGRAAAAPQSDVTAVAAVAASWTDQPGLPRLSVTQRCDAGQTLVTFRQTRHSAQPEALAGGPWLIPLRLAYGSQTQTLLMKGVEQTVAFGGCEPLPLLANSGGRGYYRVGSKPALRARLVSAFATLAPADRMALLPDSYALARAGQQPMVDHISLLRAVPQAQGSSRAALFAMALTQWRALDTALADTPAQAPVRAAAHALFAPELERLGWQVAPGEGGETQTLRADLIRGLAQFAHAPTLAAALGRLPSAWSGAKSGAQSGELSAAPSSPLSVPPSMRAAVLFAAGRTADEASFNAMLAALRSTDSQEERRNLVAALTAGIDPARARRLLDESLSGRLPKDISSSLPGWVSRDPSLLPLSYDFVVTDWDEYRRLAGDGLFGGHNRLLSNAAASSSDPTLARRLRKREAFALAAALGQ